MREAAKFWESARGAPDFDVNSATGISPGRLGSVLSHEVTDSLSKEDLDYLRTAGTLPRQVIDRFWPGYLIGDRQIRDVLREAVEAATGRTIEPRRMQHYISSSSLIHERHGIPAMAQADVDRFVEETLLNVKSGNARKTYNLFRLSG